MEMYGWPKNKDFLLNPLVKFDMTQTKNICNRCHISLKYFQSKHFFYCVKNAVVATTSNLECRHKFSWLSNLADKDATDKIFKATDYCSPPPAHAFLNYVIIIIFSPEHSLRNTYCRYKLNVNK